MLLAGGCASLVPLTPGRAATTAGRGMCSEAELADSTCVVRSVEHIAGGYRVIVDRHPPAGNDRVAVEVSPRGSIVVTPVDTAKD